MLESAALHRERLAGLAGVEDGAIGLAEAAFALAGLHRPAACIEDYLGYRDDLADQLAGCGARDCGDRAEALAEVLAVRHRYRGDDRDDEDVANANLMWVVDHRRGVAGALGLLALDVARAAGWTADGLAVPGRFVVRLHDGDGRRLIVDPFDRCRVVEPPGLRALVKATTGQDLEPSYFVAAGNREILVRLQNDVKLRLLRCALVAEALEVTEATLLFAPECDSLWRECGLMHLRLGNPKAAIAALEQFVARTGNAQARRRALQQLQDIRQRLM